jgi:hypothetical protein
MITPSFSIVVLSDGDDTSVFVSAGDASGDSSPVFAVSLLIGDAAPGSAVDGSCVPVSPVEAGPASCDSVSSAHAMPSADEQLFRLGSRTALATRTPRRESPAARPRAPSTSPMTAPTSRGARSA